MLSGSDTKRQVVLAIVALKGRLWKLERAVRAGGQDLWWIISCYWLSCDGLNLLLELWVNLFNILWSYQNTGLSIGCLFQPSLCAFSDCGCQNIDSCSREL